MDVGRLLRAAEPLGGAEVSEVAASRRGSIAAAETEAAARGCTQTVHFTYDFQARGLYERNGDELVGQSRELPHREPTSSGTASA